MKVVITGGLGFLGQRLARALLDRETLTGASGEQERIDEMVLFDAVVPDQPPAGLEDERVSLVAGDVADGETVRALIAGDSLSVFHFASVVSAGAEQDFDLALAVNLTGGLNALEACRAAPGLPRLVLHQQHRGLRRQRPAGDHLRRDQDHPAGHLWRDQGDQRAPRGRLHPQGLFGRPRRQAAHRHRAAGQAEQGGLRLRQRALPRAARRCGPRAPGQPGTRASSSAATTRSWTAWWRSTRCRVRRSATTARSTCPPSRRRRGRWWRPWSVWARGRRLGAVIDAPDGAVQRLVGSWPGLREGRTGRGPRPAPEPAAG